MGGGTPVGFLGIAIDIGGGVSDVSPLDRTCLLFDVSAVGFLM
jgi:hypothetical protein